MTDRQDIMMIRDVCLAYFDPVEGEASAAADYAVDVAARRSAHLTIAAGVPMSSIASLSPVFSLADIEAEANAARRAGAGAFVERIRDLASIAGLSASIEVRQNALFPIYEEMASVARVHDLSIVDAPHETDSSQRDFVEDLIEASGAPVLLVPEGWAHKGEPGRTIVAWNGGKEAARAMHQAMPFLSQSAVIDVVTVTGESPRALRGAQTRGDGAGAAAHLARHCREVVTSSRPIVAGRVVHTLQLHAEQTGAELIVMGFYGHSRLREAILGGATREALGGAAVPILLAA
jgi:nucleotide-binding universal stress UspA family protein